MPRLSAGARRGFARPILWAGLIVLVAALVVLATSRGVDILALLIAGFLLLLLERTLGDWVAEALGPVPTVVIFATIAALGVAYLTAGGGRARVSRLFEAAEARGYHTVYFSLDDGTEAGAASMIGAVSDRLPAPADAPVPQGTMGSPAPASGSVASPTAAPIGSGGAGPATSGGATRRDHALPTGAASSAGQSGPAASGVRVQRVIVSPEVGVIGQALSFRALVSAETAGRLPAIEFSVDGRTVATASPGADGFATAAWKTMVPGQYVIRARVPGGFGASAGASATLNVLPGRR